jgi:hypothetical protein
MAFNLVLAHSGLRISNRATDVMLFLLKLMRNINITLVGPGHPRCITSAWYAPIVLRDDCFFAV